MTYRNLCFQSYTGSLSYTFLILILVALLCVFVHSLPSDLMTTSTIWRMTLTMNPSSTFVQAVGRPIFS